MQDDAVGVVGVEAGDRCPSAQQVRDHGAAATVSTRATDVSAASAAVQAPRRRSRAEISWDWKRSCAPLLQQGGRGIILAILVGVTGPSIQNAVALVSRYVLVGYQPIARALQHTLTAP
ncbi:hypothetical protein ASF58_05810 [Methylobacterium sp. Leaf125]|nr:hypothetical protein ASF58_05810 [Methylobacterium sp. Leaf125]